MIRFIKPTKLAVPTLTSTLLKLDMNSEDNLIGLDKLDIGFAVKKYLTEAKDTSADDILKFKKECRRFL